MRISRSVQAVRLSLFALLSFTLVACETSGPPPVSLTPAIKAYWEPPFVPIKFGIDTNGNVSAEFAKQLAITTLVGKFGLEGSISAPIEPGTIRLVFVDRGHGIRTVYEIAVGDVPVVVDIEGNTTLKVTSRVIEVDITGVTCVEVRREEDPSPSGCSEGDNAAPQASASSTQSRSSSHAGGYCYGECWNYDTTTHTMTWTGPVDGIEDVWQPEGTALSAIRRGDTAVFGPMSVPGEIEACILIIGGKTVKSACDGVLFQVPAGAAFEISSPGEVGGFRWKPLRGYGYRK